MQYHIKIENGNIIASFINECDRDTCIDALREEHFDCGDDYFYPFNGNE